MENKIIETTIVVYYRNEIEALTKLIREGWEIESIKIVVDSVNVHKHEFRLSRFIQCE